MIFYHPENRFYSLEELEEKLQFYYLREIAFESPESRQEIWEKGIDLWVSRQTSPEAERLGALFHEKIESDFLPKVSIRWLSPELEHGLFAEELILEGAYVGEYTGIIRENDLRRYIGKLNNYCYNYPVKDSLERDYVIDAQNGNFTRFINHSSQPNLEPHHVFYGGFYHLIFLAKRAIEPGEQLTYNYGQNYWQLREPPVSF